MTDTPTGRSPETARALRFCMITTFYPPWNFGGDGIFVQRLAQALAERGHHVTVIHCTDAYRLAASAAPSKQAPGHPGIEVHSLHSRLGPLSPLITHQFAVPGPKGPEIRRILDAGKFDVIHFHNTSLVGGPGVLSYGDAVKLYTAHEYWLLCPLSTLWKYDRGPCTKKACTTCMLRAGKPPQWWRYSGVLKRKLRHMDALLAPSRFMIEKHREWGLGDFVHLPNFLPASQAHDAPAGQSPGSRPFFLMVGRLEKSKGFHRVIECFRALTGTDLVIVGSGQYDTELRRLAGDCEHIRLTGQLDYAELVELYARATAVIVPSIWFEPFGLIVLEAFAQRTPVIVNEAGALPELVEQSGGGLSYSDDAGLVEAVQRLLQDHALRDALGTRGYDAWRRDWTEERHLEQYLELIIELRQKRASNGKEA